MSVDDYFNSSCYFVISLTYLTENHKLRMYLFHIYNIDTRITRFYEVYRRANKKLLFLFYVAHNRRWSFLFAK